MCLAATVSLCVHAAARMMNCDVCVWGGGGGRVKKSRGSCWSHSSKGHVQRSALNVLKDRLSILCSVLRSHTSRLHGCSTVQDYDMRSFGIGMNGRRQCKSTPQLSVRKSGVYAGSHSHTTAIAINTLRYVSVHLVNSLVYASLICMLIQ